VGELDVDSSNWSAGTGVIDSYNSLITDIKNAHDEDKGVAAAEIGVAVFGAVVDTVATILNPLGKLIAAGLGWLIEHVEFLKKPLDWLTGDPTAIKALADQLHEIGQDLRNTATDMDSTLNASLASWTGTASENFHTIMSGRRSDIDGAGHSVDVAGYVVETTMALIGAVRALIRDMVTSTLGDIIATMLIALASAPFTFGASIAVGVSKCVIEGVAKVAEMTSKIAKLVGFSAKVVKRIDDLVAVLKKTATNLGNKYSDLRGLPKPADDAGSTHSTDSDDGASFHTADDGASTHSSNSDDSASTHSSDSDDDEFHDAQDHFDDAPPAPHEDATPPPHDDEPAPPHDDTEPANANANGDDAPAPHDDDAAPAPHDDDAPPPAHDETAPANANGDDAPAPLPPAKTGESLLKPLDHPNLKLHEEWLKQAGFGDDLNKVKFNENWLKQNHPDLFTTLKTISDLKSSKNMVGLTDKYVTQVIKQLADIHERAQMSWDDANTQWQQEHPGSKA
jgi:hypothetical protein